MPALPLLGVLASLALAGAGCSGRCVRDGDCRPYQVCSGGRCIDAGQPDGDADADQDADRDVDEEEDRDADLDLDDDYDYDFDLSPGEVRALLLTSLGGSVALVCDVDGDGSLDNAFASASPLLVTSFVAILAASAEDNSGALALDLHSIQDPATPAGEAFVGTFAGAIDCDADPRNNDAPGQLLDANPGFYDAAGDPSNPLAFDVDDGVLEGGGEIFSGLLTTYDAPLHFHRPWITGLLTPGMGRLIDGLLCAYALASELDSIELSGYDATALGAVVAPGVLLGDPAFVGTQPDVDIDRDGLEWLGADAGGRITTCRDGDGTVFESTESERCTARPEIADGFSMTLTLEAVAARLMVPGRAGEGCPVPP